MGDFTVSELLWFYLGQPWAFGLIALVLCGGVLIVRTRGRSGGAVSTFVPVLPASLRWTAGALLSMWALRAVLPWVATALRQAGFGIRWAFPPYSELIWLLAPPVLMMFGLWCFERAQQKRVVKSPDPGVRTMRRHWRSYLGRAPIAVASSLMGVLLLVTTWAGLGSVQDPEGWFIGATVVGNDHVSGSAMTFGWTYGVPSSCAALILVVVGISVLRGRALAPFSETTSQLDATRQRYISASGVSQLIIAALGLTLGSAFAIIGFGARSVVSYSIPSTGESGSWRTTYAAFSDPALGLWLVLTVCSLALLLVLAVTGRPLGFGRMVGGKKANNQETFAVRSDA